ncbi:MAG: Ppx/GppA family phosphatase [Candidatus Latescibacteria bacterium]|nr:Ppx/GppA family phosphatase [Candidatus Latescibacterota bacterium]
MDRPVSVIDLGTNTILMVTGRHQGGKVEILDDAHVIARLGKGVDAQGLILPETMDRVCTYLAQYRDRAQDLGAKRVAAFGTSALRDAANGPQFIDRVRREVGIKLVVVPGQDEARLTFRGARFGLDLPTRYGVLDIGGGSTELAVGSDQALELSHSVDVGGVRVTERCFGTLPPSQQEVTAASDFIRQRLQGLTSYPRGVPLVGVAGTATTLGAIDSGQIDFKGEQLNGYTLSRSRLHTLADHLLTLSLEQIQAIPQIDPKRADIIAAGSLILRLAVDRFDVDGLTISTRGIRYGLLLEVLAGKR